MGLCLNAYSPAAGCFVEALEAEGGVAQLRK